ncbi:MAG: intradiol ring-cleavage dioxygenase [Cyclobacteriaceae bacterium]
MKNEICIALILLFVSSCNAQEKKAGKQLVGGPCEGCEAIYEYGTRKLTAIDTLPKFSQSTPKLKVTGIVYQKDGKTPAENIILYIYHTNRKGIYETHGNEKGWASRHGYIRGWVKTGKDGRYTFYTFRPAAYPERTEPEHIHITVKEPTKNEYYIDGYFFDDDPLLTKSKRNDLSNRGGSGIVRPKHENELLIISRNIILGYNIPNYE